MGQLASNLRNETLAFYNDQRLAAQELVIAAEDAIRRELETFCAKVMCEPSKVKSTAEIMTRHVQGTTQC